MKRPKFQNFFQKNKSKLKLLKIWSLILLGSLIVIEIVLRVIGMKPGVLYDDFIVQDNPINDERLVADSIGISHINPNAYSLMRGTVVNEQGFLGLWNYTSSQADSVRNSGKKIVMLVGDSFTEGCCADHLDYSFPNLLRSDHVEVANFGVSCADPVQYRLIVEEYLDKIKPDKLVVVVYLGNDILQYDRKPSPGVPLAYVFRGNKWLISEEPHWVSGRYGYVFKTADEAYQYYLDQFTLKGENRNWFEKVLSYSVISSKLYLGIEHYRQTRRAADLIDIQESPPYSNINLRKIDSVARSQDIPCYFVAICPPQEAEDWNAATSKYNFVFEDLEWSIPRNMNLEHYDGEGLGNHFNNSGHKMFAEYLRQTLGMSAKQSTQ